MSYSYFHASNHDLIALFRLLGKGVLRIGGGSVDRVSFVRESKGTHSQVTVADINGLAVFLQQTGWTCLYGINFAASTPALAAEEAAYVSKALGSNLLGIEIGNEPDEYGISGHFFAGDWNIEDYLARWEVFRTAIIEAAPLARVTGPAAGGGSHIESWTLPFGWAKADEITLLTQHYYRASGGSPLSTASFLISPDPQLSGDLGTLQAGGSELGLPYRLSECNSFYNGGSPGVSNSYASSLWVIDFLFAAATNHASGVNMHGGGQPTYTPIADDSGGVIEARPEYYGLLFFSLAGTGTLLATEVMGSANATAYAVRTPAGGLNVMVVNKEPVQDLTLTIDANQTIQNATLQLLLGPSLAATSGITIQGATVEKDGTFIPDAPTGLATVGTKTLCHIPALSAALITIS